MRNDGMRAIAKWEEVPIFDSEEAEADFWSENRPDLRLMESALAGLIRLDLLIVIHISGTVASMLRPLSRAVNRSTIRPKARVDLEQLATAVELSRAKLGHYPPDGPGSPSTNQLYSQLLGTTF